MLKPSWEAPTSIAFVAVMVGVVLLAQACGGSGDGDVTPTATTPPTSAADGGAAGMPDFTPGAGMPGQGMFIGGASEEFAAFLGISFEQLESELDAEGATPGSVAEAHGRTREELEAFFLEQLEANLSEAVAAGTMSQEDADNMFERQASLIDDIIDGEMPSGGRGPAPSGQ